MLAILFMPFGLLHLKGFQIKCIPSLLTMRKIMSETRRMHSIRYSLFITQISDINTIFVDRITHYSDKIFRVNAINSR
jgi:hypothetical protein